MPATFDIKNISLRAKGLVEGIVTPEEVEFARSILRRRDDRNGGIVFSIGVVGLCGNAADAPLLESYLHGDHNNVHAEWALKALCRFLRLTDRYRPLLRQWMQMRDDEGCRRIGAIHLAPEYFSDFEDAELGRYLIDVLCDFNDRCRGSVRSVFIDILHLSNQLEDPFGLEFDDWDEETTLIVEAAAMKFGYHDWKISHGRAVN